MDTACGVLSRCILRRWRWRWHPSWQTGWRAEDAHVGAATPSQILESLVLCLRIVVFLNVTNYSKLGWSRARTFIVIPPYTSIWALPSAQEPRSSSTRLCMRIRFARFLNVFQHHYTASYAAQRELPERMPRRTLAARRRLGTFDILTDCFLYTNDIQFFSVPSKRDVGFKYTGFSLCLSLFCRLIKIIPVLPPPPHCPRARGSIRRKCEALGIY